MTKSEWRKNDEPRMTNDEFVSGPCQSHHRRARIDNEHRMVRRVISSFGSRHSSFCTLLLVLSRAYIYFAVAVGLGGLRTTVTFWTSAIRSPPITRSTASHETRCLSMGVKILVPEAIRPSAVTPDVWSIQRSPSRWK